MTTPHLPLANELAAVFARMSGLLLSSETVRSALKLVTALAKEAIPAASGAGVTLMGAGGDRETAAATDAHVERADALQYEFDQGPCLTAWARRTVVRIDDVRTDDRWPRWAQVVAEEAAVRCVVSAPMVAGGRGLGAIKVYAREPGTFDERAELLLSMFAAQAAVLLANVRAFEDAERVSDELKSSMRGRDLINIAKGVLMAREGTDEQTAFMLLSKMASEQHRPLREVAEELAGTTLRRRR